MTCMDAFQEEYSVDPGHIHIIGHSLGAHIGGYVGDRTPHLGRITGLIGLKKSN